MWGTLIFGQTLIILLLSGMIITLNTPLLIMQHIHTVSAFFLCGIIWHLNF